MKRRQGEGGRKETTLWTLFSDKRWIGVSSVTVDSNRHLLYWVDSVGAKLAANRISVTSLFDFQLTLGCIMHALQLPTDVLRICVEYAHCFFYDDWAVLVEPPFMWNLSLYGVDSWNQRLIMFDCAFELRTRTFSPCTF